MSSRIESISERVGGIDNTQSWDVMASFHDCNSLTAAMKKRRRGEKSGLPVIVYGLWSS